MDPRSSASSAPWSEVLRACAANELHPCVFGMSVRLGTDRLEPRDVRLVLESAKRSVDLDPVYACPCGAFALGTRNAVLVEDIATSTGAAKMTAALAIAMKQARVELNTASEPHLRTVAAELHANLLRRLCIHATRWNLPPYATLGRTRARPAECWHRG